MLLWSQSINTVTVVAQGVAFTGLIARGRARHVVTLPLYLGVATLLQGVRLLPGDVARSWSYWVLKELLLLSLMTSVVLEIAVRVFARLPQAKQRAWLFVLVVVAGTGVAVWQAPGMAGNDQNFGAWRQIVVIDVLPRLAVGGALLSLATAAAMAYYRLPLDPLHRVVLFGLAVFLVVYAGPMGSAGSHASGRFVMYYVTPLVYLAVVMLWAWIAWRVERQPDAPQDVVERLHPWRQDGRS